MSLLGALVGLGVIVAACSSGSDDNDTKASKSKDDTTATATGKASTQKVEFSTYKDASNLKVVDPPKQDGVQHLKFKFGPIDIKPGQNNITYSGRQIPKPDVDGWIVGIYPNLIREDGSIPPVDVVHLHHGVWANLSAEPDEGRGITGIPAELFFASGEEKTKMILPAGYGYEYQANDRWIINYMLHNLLSTPDKVWIVYDLDFIPKTSPAAAKIKKARPVWMDVQKGHIYPVFDVLKGTGTNGQFTYPDDAGNPYGTGPKLNEWTVDRDSILLAAAGHLHPGGLHVDLGLRRQGAKPTAVAAPSVKGDTAHIFRSDAVYYEPAGAVSWDVAMTATPADWRVAVKKGDVLRVSATYDTKKASWYESMGISIVWMTDATPAEKGNDPFATPVDAKTPVLTHGHLPENDNHGGKPTDKFVDATKLPNGPATNKVTIADFTYGAGDIGNVAQSIPTVKAGQELSFYNQDAPRDNGIWHTITACQAPCNQTTGVAYPLADAQTGFDSGELGVAGPPTANRVDWSIPTDLSPGTYTYFCRIHPSMRGAFRVVP